MASLHKKGDPLECGNFRGLLVASHLSKAATGVLKPPVLEAALEAQSHQQLGGKPGHEVPMAPLFCTAFLTRARARGRPAGAIFADLLKAFDLAVREIAIGVRDDVTEAQAVQRF
eukprot:5649693-Lingulodinium_polyedra.AAC.1